MLIFLDGFFKYLKEADQWLFLKINSQWTNPVFDFVLPVYRDQLFWMPLYVFLFVFMVMNFKQHSIRWFLLIAITLIFCDQLSSHIIKPWIGRLRPCQDPDLLGQAKLLLGYCPGNRSFTSSHATNHFGAGVFIFFTLRNDFKKYAVLFLLWAASVCYAQVYIGVHYPLDVLGGAILGSIIGLLIAKLYLSKYIFSQDLRHHNAVLK